MFLEGTLIEKLRKLEALHAGTKVDGEREAARRAAERIRERLAEARRKIKRPTGASEPVAGLLERTLRGMVRRRDGRERAELRLEEGEMGLSSAGPMELGLSYAAWPSARRRRTVLFQ